MKAYDVSISLPDINKSKLTFSPSLEENKIYYGLKGISKINDKVAEDILLCRPYNSFEDLISKVKLTKPQIISLIKGGAFDRFGDRLKIMKSYIYSISDTKSKLTLQNMPMLITKNLIPLEMDFYRKLFNFNKYIKTFKREDYYDLDMLAFKFFEANFDIDLVNFSSTNDTILGSIDMKLWDKTYKKMMDPMRLYLKSHEEEMLDKLNFSLSQSIWEKYATGSLSKWEMESVSYYFHAHELAHVDLPAYGISNFFELSEEPELDYSFTTKDGFDVSIHKLHRIAGTVLDKDATKSTVTILTLEGVVTVKIWKNQFAKYNKQISALQPDGKKKIIEKSWFARGNKIILTGVRRDSNFIPKVYKNSEWKSPISLIEDIAEDGTLKIRTLRGLEDEI